MRKIININENWEFIKNTDKLEATENIENISLPHTWNGIDGQDGGNDYFRGKCLYRKNISKKDLPESEKYYLEINGANSSVIC